MREVKRPVPINPPHLLITASAGSGKTWRLSRRLAALILAGEPPETLVALTFTRKAAGEFFDALLGLIAGAASDAGQARRLAAELGGGPECPEEFLPVLRRLTGLIHRLQFTTIDSFFYRIVSGFPLELGLSGNFVLMDAFAAQRARADVLEELLRRDAPGAQARRHFLESFKQATFGKEQKFAASEVVDFVDELYPLYLDAPQLAAWAGEDCPLVVPEEKPGAAAALWQEATRRLPAARVDSARMELWEQAGPYLRNWEPGAVPSATIEETIRKNILEAVDVAGGTCGEFVLNRKKIRPDAALGRALHGLASLWAGRVMRVCLQRTRGTARVLAAYHAAYDEKVRRTGRLVFDDLPRIIGAAGEGGLARLEVDYRLDARFRHWLLDEFQDTSRTQWAVLENLIDEAVQDPEGRRTFFCVGDRKQSIYAWRGGDHRLFDELKAKYGVRLGTESLLRTFRCSGAVVDMVNRVMGRRGLAAELGPGGDAWEQGWEAHESARPGTGFAAYVEAAGGEIKGVSARHQLIASLIEKARPAEQGWSCAVLVYSNDEARALADVLRASLQLPVVLEGEIRPALDNTLGVGLLAWARALAHPTDTLAEGWILASPGGAWLCRMGDWRMHGLAAIHRRGVLEAGREWMEALAEQGPDRFLEQRRAELLRALRQFEEAGGRDPGQLEDYLRHYALRAPAAPGSVQVMTIHKAKGLGFDMVVLTQLARENHGFKRRRDGPLVARDARGRVRWICEAPPKDYLPFFPQLCGLAEEAEAQNVYEQLCLLYVGLTRAKEALYVVGEQKISSGTQVHAQHVIRRGLEGVAGTQLYCGVPAVAVFGVEDQAPARRETTAVADWQAPELDYPALPGQRYGGGGKEHPAWAVSESVRESKMRGIRVHKLLARIDRATPLVLAALEKEVGGEEAGREALACARAAELKDIFLPPEEVTIWREKAFQCVLRDGPVAGVLDRVLLWPEDGGGWRQAMVVDFKTDRIEPPELPILAERHRDQLLAYRAALAHLLDMDPLQICCRVVSTVLRKAVEVR